MAKGGSGSHWDGCEEAHHDCALAKLREAQAVIERLGKELEEAQELVLRLNEVAASLARRVHTYITSDSYARDKLANGVGHDMIRIPSLEPFLAQRVTEGGEG
jgi:hypothetical protein